MPDHLTLTSSTTHRTASRSASAVRAAGFVTATCSDSTRRCDATLTRVSIGTTRSRLRLRSTRRRSGSQATIWLLHVVLGARQTGTGGRVRGTGRIGLWIDGIALHAAAIEALRIVPGRRRLADMVDISADLLAIFLQVGTHLLALLLQGHILLLGERSRRNGSEQQYQR